MSASIFPLEEPEIGEVKPISSDAGKYNNYIVLFYHYSTIYWRMSCFKDPFLPRKRSREQEEKPVIC